MVQLYPQSNRHAVSEDDVFRQPAGTFLLMGELIPMDWYEPAEGVPWNRADHIADFLCRLDWLDYRVLHLFLGRVHTREEIAQTFQLLPQDVMDTYESILEALAQYVESAERIGRFAVSHVTPN